MFEEFMKFRKFVFNRMSNFCEGFIYQDFFWNIFETKILISYNKTNGMARSNCETGSVPGERNAASIIITTIACLLYFFISFGVSKPILERKNESIGSSKINP